MGLQDTKNTKQSKRGRKVPSDMRERKREHISMTIGFKLKNLNEDNINVAINNLSRTRFATRQRSCKYLQDEMNVLPPNKSEKTVALYKELLRGSTGSHKGTRRTRADELDIDFREQKVFGRGYGKERKALQTADPFIHKKYYDQFSWDEYWIIRNKFIRKNSKEEWYKDNPI